MTYDKDRLIDRVTELLRASPTRPLQSIADELRVDRHTITRRLLEQGRLSFRDLQVDFVADTLRRLDGGREILTKQQMASALGCSVRTLAAWERRLHCNQALLRRRAKTGSSGP